MRGSAEADSHGHLPAISRIGSSPSDPPPCSVKGVTETDPCGYYIGNQKEENRGYASFPSMGSQERNERCGTADPAVREREDPRWQHWRK